MSKNIIILFIFIIICYFVYTNYSYEKFTTNNLIDINYSTSGDNLYINNYNEYISNNNNIKSVKNISTSIILLIKDGSSYIEYLNKLFHKIEQTNEYSFEYFIYENNSVDDTELKIANFYKNRNGKFINDDLNDIYYKEISNERGTHMSMLRNKLKDLHGKLTSKYTLLLDCDVIFLEDAVINMINLLESNKNIAMGTSFSICWENYISNNTLHYYDSLALITKDNISYRENNNTCMFKECYKCIKLREQNKIKIDNSKLLSMEKVQSVNSAFSGFALIRTDIYNNVAWGSGICEHHSFCKNIKQYGDIVIDPYIKTISTTNNKREYDVIEYHLEHNLSLIHI
jgi:hypothetical protein